MQIEGSATFADDLKLLLVESKVGALKYPLCETVCSINSTVYEVNYNRREVLIPR